MMDAIATLRAKGHVIADNDLVHLSPSSYAHINPYGKYHFETMPSLEQQLETSSSMTGSSAFLMKNKCSSS